MLEWAKLLISKNVLAWLRLAIVQREVIKGGFVTHLQSALDRALKVLRLSVGWLHVKECLDKLEGFGILLQLRASHSEVEKVISFRLGVTMVK